MAKAYKTKRGKYHDWIEKDGLIRLEGWARDGLNDEQIAHNMGIATGTLYEYKKNYPEIAEALKRGKQVVDIEVENALLKRALGYKVEETKTIVEDGAGQKRKVERTVKEVAPDTTAAIFWLKNRKPDQWRDRYNQEHSGQVDLDVTHQYEEMSEEELKELAKKYGDIIEEE